MKNIFKRLFVFVLVFTAIISMYNCSKEEEKVNQPPVTPVNPLPADNEDSVSLSTVLSWAACADPENDSVKYDVYMGTSNPPALVGSNILTNSYKPDTLLSLTKYYWKVVAKDNKNNTASSTVWKFTTKEEIVNLPPTVPTNPTPANNNVSVLSTPVLSWSVCADPENEPVKYDVYLGTSNPPALSISNLLINNYTPNTLIGSTKYYWKVVAKDNVNSASSIVWNFTTLPNGNLNVLVCDQTQVNYFGGAEVFLYKSEQDRTNDPQRNNYFRKALTDISNPITNGAIFYDMSNQIYYIFARFNIGGGDWITGQGQSFVPSGVTTNTLVNVN